MTWPTPTRFLREALRSVAVTLLCVAVTVGVVWVLVFWI